MTSNLTALGDIFEFKNGRSFKKKEWRTSGIPIIRIQNLNDTSAKFNYFDGAYDKSIQVDSGDLLFSWSGTVGSSFGPHIWNRERGVLNQHIYKLYRKKEISWSYAYYALLAITKEIEKKVVGAVGLVHVTKKSLNAFKINLPSLATQQKTVERLDKIFAEIERASEATKASAKNVEAILESYLTEIFEGECDRKKIGEILKLEYGKGLDSSERDVNGKFNAYGANGVKAKTNKFLYDKPSIIVGRKGSAGELTLVNDKFWALDVTYYVTHDHNVIDLMYIYYALKTKKLTSYAKGVKPGINRNDIYDIKIPVPSLQDQKNLVEKLNKVNCNVTTAYFAYHKKCIELDKLRQSILQQTFNAEFVKD